MKIVNPSFDILLLCNCDLILKHIEKCARKCYQSEHLITENSAPKFIRKLIDMGHESTIEHVSITVDVVCDRGVSHEVVRHRLCSFSQESTRYVNYSKDKFGKEICVIKPFFFDPMEPRKEIILPDILEAKFTPKTYKLNSFDIWFIVCQFAEWGYNTLIETFQAKAQEARSILPNSTKTAISITANLREWRHIFKLRCSRAAHPQMRQIMLPLLEEMNNKIPIIFNDYYNQYKSDIDSFKNKS